MPISMSRTCSPLIVLAVFATACQSQITGNEGNLVFSYTADDAVSDFNKPIAVGAKLQLRVREAGTNLPATIQSAISDDGDVLAVDSFTTNQLILEAKSAGNVLIEVEAAVAGKDAVTDSVNMRAAEATRHELRHTCADATVRNFTYFANSEDIYVYYDLFTANNEAAIGYGLFPVTLEPASGATLDQTSTSQFAYTLDLGDPGTLTLTSSIDNSTLTMNLVSKADVDGAELSPLSASTAILVNQNAFVSVSPTVGGERVCQAKMGMTAESLTPEICTVAVPGAVDDELKEALYESLFVRIDGLALGTCEFEVSLPDGANGAGTKSTLSVSIGEAP